MKRVPLMLAVILFSASHLLAFSSAPPAPPEKVAIDPMFDTYVTMGDSLTHGFQGGSVDETRQPDTYGKRLANLMNTEFVQGLLRFPGFLVNMEDVGKNNIAWYEYYYAITGGDRVDDWDDQDSINNFGITGADIRTALESGGDEGGYYKLALGKNGAPMVTQALDRNPTFVSVWLGNNDTLSCALFTDAGKLTPLADFQQKYSELISKITSKGSIEGAILINLPDVVAIPYLEPANDPDVPAGSYKAFWNTNVSDVDEVLTPSDINQITARTEQFNDIIEGYALANGWAFLDVNTIFDDILTYGHNLKNGSGYPSGRIVTADYLGGIFSLDGVHLSSTGQATVANFIADAIDYNYAAGLGNVDEFQASENDTLYKDPYDPRGLIDSWIGQAVQWVIEIFI